MKRIELLWGLAAIAVALCLGVACNVIHPTTENTTPTPSRTVQAAATPIVNQIPATPIVNQTPATAVQQSPEDKMPRIPAREAIELVKAGKAVLVDVRGIEIYRLEHPKGALSLPLAEIEQHHYKAMREDGSYVELPRDKRIIAYCT